MTEILGFDEVGRGCLAGPVVVGCVFGDRNLQQPENVVIRDSKKMSRFQRQKASKWILDHFAYGIGEAGVSEIDSYGIQKAVLMAASRAFQNFTKTFPFLLHTAYQIQNDGNVPWFKEGTAIIKGDDLIKEISMASIIAKVYRDNIMFELSGKYPAWGFERHVGYGTKYHIKKIVECGILQDIHRKTFIHISPYI